MDINRKLKMEDLRRIEGEPSTQRARIVGYLIACIAALVLYLLLRLQIFEKLEYSRLIQKVVLAAFLVAFVLLVAKLIELAFIRHTDFVYTRYNRTKLVRLLSWILIIAVLVSFLFRNWYSAVVSLGLISLILGFALQSPIASFIGWIYILVRQPYHVGDRIQIAEFRGDVVEVNYLDTTLWEFSGDYLTNDLPSGRLIRFPNSLVLQSPVLNYSWEKFPYIWNEVPFHVAYESDLAFVEETIKRVAREELKGMADNVEHFRELLNQTPVDELEVREYPFVSYRISNNTWVEVIVTYLVSPKTASFTRSMLIRQILSELRKHPDRVLFPKSNSR